MQALSVLGLCRGGIAELLLLPGREVLLGCFVDIRRRLLEWRPGDCPALWNKPHQRRAAFGQVRSTASDRGCRNGSLIKVARIDPDDDPFYEPLRDERLAVDGNLYPANSKLAPLKDGDFEEFVDVAPYVYGHPGYPGHRWSR
jgi:hypothetical protein